MKYCGGTFPEHKSILCIPEITVLGHQCTIDERLPNKSRVNKIVNWGPCKDLTDVHTFLGTIGVCRLFIRNFSHCAHHLVKLTRKGISWGFGPEQLAAMKDLNQALLSSPALQPINYTSSTLVILSVDTSYIAISFILSQCNPNNPKLWYHAQFSSITLNKREQIFYQPKLKLYSLLHALQLLKLYLISIWNLIIEVNARYIKGMLKNSMDPCNSYVSLYSHNVSPTPQRWGRHGKTHQPNPLSLAMPQNNVLHVPIQPRVRVGIGMGITSL